MRASLGPQSKHLSLHASVKIWLMPLTAQLTDSQGFLWDKTSTAKWSKISPFILINEVMAMEHKMNLTCCLINIPSFLIIILFLVLFVFLTKAFHFHTLKFDCPFCYILRRIRLDRKAPLSGIHCPLSLLDNATLLVALTTTKPGIRSILPFWYNIGWSQSCVTLHGFFNFRHYITVVLFS